MKCGRCVCWSEGVRVLRDIRRRCASRCSRAPRKAEKGRDVQTIDLLFQERMQVSSCSKCRTMPNEVAPLLVFHGGARWRLNPRIQRISCSRGPGHFIVVYPQALSAPGGWAGRHERPEKQGVNVVRSLRAVVRRRRANTRRRSDPRPASPPELSNGAAAQLSVLAVRRPTPSRPSRPVAGYRICCGGLAEPCRPNFSWSRSSAVVVCRSVDVPSTGAMWSGARGGGQGAGRRGACRSYGGA
jgi:hypothetical protein